MKTRAKVSKFLKNLSFFALMAVFAVSCGKDNTSGKSGNSGSGFTSGIGSYGTFPNQASLPQIMQVVAQQNPCWEGGQRSTVQIALQMNVNVGSSYMGVTPFGDIMVVSNYGQPRAELYICPRAIMSQGTTGGTLTRNPIVQADPLCPIGKIDAATVVFNTNWGPVQLPFAPIHIPGTNRISQLCQAFQ
jgi:hypothetical protein